MDYPLPDIQYDKEKKYIIYGTGDVAKSYYEQLVKIISEDNVSYFIDSVKKQDFLYGKKVLLPSELDMIDKKSYLYILGTLSSAASMEGELLKRGISSNNIIKCNQYSVDVFDLFQRPIKKILLYPSFPNIEELKKIIEKFVWYVPELVEKDIIVEYQYITENVEDIIIPSAFNFQRTDKSEMESYDLILIWDKVYLMDKIFHSFTKIFCIDPSFYQGIDAKILTRLNYKISEKDWNMISKHNYQKLEAMCSSYTRAFVFGSGPSFEEGSEKCRQMIQPDDIRIVCNACILNKSAIGKCSPNLYVLIDIFYLTEELKGQLDLIVEYMIKHKGFLIVQKCWMPLLNSRYPEIESILIGMDESATEVCFPNSESCSVYAKAHNVITKYAIPIASALAEDIYISGCDGARIVGNTSVWDYCNGTKVVSLRQAYTLEHYAYFEELLQYGEAEGKRYIPLTASYIPALESRFNERT